MEGTRSGLVRNPLELVGGLVFVVGFLVFAIAGFTSVNNVPFGGSPDFSGVICGFVIAGVGIALLIVARAFGTSSTIPPPPPIQQPMVPAGLQGPVSLNCPACGAPAGDVDRFGVAMCAHCNTRYLVR